MQVPVDRVYSESHEWHRSDGDTITIGLTQFAIDQLTDITFVEMKPVGTTVDAGDAIGEVESVKATSDVYSAPAGEIVEVNSALSDDPSLLNRDPYDGGWLVKLRVSDAGGLGSCMDAETYASRYGS